MKKLLLCLFIMSLFAGNCYALPFVKEQPTFVQKEEYQALSEEANVYYAQNNIKEAQNVLLSIPEDERSAQNWLILGNIMQDFGKLNEAEFMFKKAIEVDDKYYKAYYNLGNLYTMQDKPNMALEQYLKVTKLKPDYAYGYYNLGCTYLKLEKYSKARFALLDAIEKKNTEPDFYYNLAYAYKKMNNKKAANTYIELYNKLMESRLY